MHSDEAELLEFLRAIAAGDASAARRMLHGHPSLANRPLESGATRQTAAEFYFQNIEHYVYRGDTALHVAAAGYRPELARELVAAGADVSAENRRGAQPLHYAADGAPGGINWRPGPRRRP